MPKRGIIQAKEDGEAAILERGILFNRNNTIITHRFPEIGLCGLPGNPVLVVEICHFTTAQPTAHLPPRVSVFEGGIQRRMLLDNRNKIRLAAIHTPCTAYVHDILEVDGRPLVDEPYEVRRSHLALFFETQARFPGLILAEEYPMELLSELQAEVRAFNDAQGDQYREGFVIKDLDAPYKPARSWAWQKWKAWREADFPILRHEVTPGDKREGFVIYIRLPNGGEQRVVIGEHAVQARVKAAAQAGTLTKASATIGYLQLSRDGRLRQLHIRALLEPATPP